MPLLLMLVKLLLLILIVSPKVNICSNIYLCRRTPFSLFCFQVLLHKYDQLLIVPTHFSRCHSSKSIDGSIWGRKILLRILKHQIMIKICHKVPDQTRIKLLHSPKNLELFLGNCVSLHTLGCRKRGHVFYVIMDPSSRSGGRREGGA